MTAVQECPVCYLPDNLRPLTCGHDLCMNCRDCLMVSHSGTNHLGHRAIKCPVCRAVNQEMEILMCGYEYPPNMRPGDYYMNPNREPGWTDYVLVTQDGRHVRVHYDLNALSEQVMSSYVEERALRRTNTGKCEGADCNKRTTRKCAVRDCDKKCCRACGTCQNILQFLF